MNKVLFFINHKRLFVCVFLMFIFAPAHGYSQTKTNIKGEVININHHLQVAFIDIDQKNLKKGDVVGVQVDYRNTVYMEVLDSSPVISKIGVGPVAERNFKSSASDFERVKIGNLVEKIEFYDPYVQRAQKESSPAKFVLEKKPRETDVDGEPAKPTGISRQISLELEESIKKIEQSDGGGTDEKEHDVPAGGEQGCRSDMIRCMEKNKRLESKISVLREKLEYMRELINKNAPN